MPSPKHGTLTAGAVTTVTLEADYGSVEILKRDAAGEMFISVDGADPVVGGDGFHILPEGVGSITLPSLMRGATVVKLISAAAIRYSVRGT